MAYIWLHFGINVIKFPEKSIFHNLYSQGIYVQDGSKELINFGAIYHDFKSY